MTKTYPLEFKDYEHKLFFKIKKKKPHQPAFSSGASCRVCTVWRTASKARIRRRRWRGSCSLRSDQWTAASPRSSHAWTWTCWSDQSEGSAPSVNRFDWLLKNYQVKMFFDCSFYWSNQFTNILLFCLKKLIYVFKIGFFWIICYAPVYKTLFYFLWYSTQQMKLLFMYFNSVVFTLKSK